VSLSEEGNAYKDKSRPPPEYPNTLTPEQEKDILTVLNWRRLMKGNGTAVRMDNIKASEWIKVLPILVKSPAATDRSVVDSDFGIVPIRLKALLEESDSIDDRTLELTRQLIQERDEFEALEAAVLDLLRLERYERRTWSRQKQAIRDFTKIKRMCSAGNAVPRLGKAAMSGGANQYNLPKIVGLAERSQSKMVCQNETNRKWFGRAQPPRRDRCDRHQCFDYQYPPALGSPSGSTA
jgi:hypothetical protein